MGPTETATPWGGPAFSPTYLQSGRGQTARFCDPPPQSPRGLATHWRNGAGPIKPATHHPPPGPRWPIPTAMATTLEQISHQPLATRSPVRPVPGPRGERPQGEGPRAAWPQAQLCLHREAWSQKEWHQEAWPRGASFREALFREALFQVGACRGERCQGEASSPRAWGLGVPQGSPRQGGCACQRAPAGSVVGAQHLAEPQPGCSARPSASDPSNNRPSPRVPCLAGMD